MLWIYSMPLCPLRGDYSVQPDVFREVQADLDRWDMGL